MWVAGPLGNDPRASNSARVIRQTLNSACNLFCFLNSYFFNQGEIAFACCDAPWLPVIVSYCFKTARAMRTDYVVHFCVVLISFMSSYICNMACWSSAAPESELSREAVGHGLVPERITANDNLFSKKGQAKARSFLGHLPLHKCCQVGSQVLCQAGLPTETLEEDGQYCGPSHEGSH